MRDFKKLEHYGIIGNLDTCALVGKDGSIDWCCFPHIESPSIFAGILDIDKGGHFAVYPSEPFESEQKYIEKTNVLQTVFHTSSGTAILTDFMPLMEEEEAEIHESQTIYRKITCNKGSVKLAVEFKPRFDYARAQTILKQFEKGVVAAWNNEDVFLTGSFKLELRGNEAFGTHTIKDGESAWMVLQYSHSAPVNPEACEDSLKSTIKYWQNWGHTCDPQKCVFVGPWHDLVVRSGLVLKLLTHHESGAICAAPTTSLPEEIRGVRNWDYRFNWIRDSAFTLQALYNLGHVKEAKNHLKWFMSLCKGTKEPSEIQIMYGMHGETDLEEQELKHLSGYRNSRPVRIGNGAAKQRQLDIYGELLNIFYETTRYEGNIPGDDWSFAAKIVDYVCQIWNTKDAGIWEVRGEPRHFVYSKLMCWVAIDKGIKIAESRGFNAPLDKWKETREEIKNAILQKGFNQKLNSFVQSFDSETLDATSFLIPLMGFLPFDDLRVQGTIDATTKQLMTKNGFVYRYQGDDGLPGKEGAFTLCSFWLINALTLSGRVEEAEKLFINISKYISPLGLLAEQIEPDTGQQLGNFPQAFSHIGLINSALYLGRAKGKKQMGPEPLGQ